MEDLQIQVYDPLSASLPLLFQVLKYCCTCPRVIEVLLNAYDRLKVTETWIEAVPPEVFKVGFNIIYVWNSGAECTVRWKNVDFDEIYN